MWTKHQKRESENWPNSEKVSRRKTTSFFAAFLFPRDQNHHFILTLKIMKMRAHIVKTDCAQKNPNSWN